MALKKLELVSSGIKELLNSEEMSAVCSSLAASVAQRCGPAWAAAPPHKTGQRVAVNVYPTSREAAAENATNDTARRAVQSMEVLL